MATVPAVPRAAPAKDTFGGWLRDRMEDSGLSQEATARLIGVSLRTLQRWYWGETEPRYSELKKVKAAFRALPPDLMRMLRSRKTSIAS